MIAFRQKPAHQKGHVGTFLKEFFTNPRHTGALFPSSKALAKRMASFVPQQENGLVVELGPGTGPVTLALLNAGVPPERLVLVEFSEELVNCLRRKFPQLKIIHGNACDLADLLDQHLGKERPEIISIVSSLPLKTLPKQVVVRISAETRKVLSKNGNLIQFTYDIRPKQPVRYEGLNRVASTIVWKNMPPARIDLLKWES